MPPLPESLQPQHHRSLLALARQAITQVIVHNRAFEEVPQHGIFAERRGVFVTLHVGGRLRGCIGVVEGHQPLGNGIVHAATSAALEDPRFPRLRAEELAELQIEISVLSPLMPIRPQEVEIGTHGLLVVSGRNRGLLLPQVALEHHLDRERFLEETCWKAGLPRDAWKKEDVLLFGFTCEIYSEASVSSY